MLIDAKKINEIIVEQR